MNVRVFTNECSQMVYDGQVPSLVHLETLMNKGLWMVNPIFVFSILRDAIKFIRQK